MNDPGATLLVVLYRWRIRPGCEDGFVSAWSQVTRSLRAAGSLGSRLHRGDDGWWYGYAQWPDAQVRAAAFATDGTPEASTAMQAAIMESLPAVALSPVADYLQHASAVSATTACGES